MCGLSFLRHNRLYHLRLLFLVESGIVIGTANHLPLTGDEMINVAEKKFQIQIRKKAGAKR